MTNPKSPSKYRAAKPVNDLPAFKDGREFDALSDQDKERVWKYYNRKIPLSETRPPTASERAALARIRKNSRPKAGQAAKIVSVKIEQRLLHRADVYAKKHEMRRAEMIAEGLKLLMGR